MRSNSQNLKQRLRKILRQHLPIVNKWTKDVLRQIKFLLRFFSTYSTMIHSQIDQPYNQIIAETKYQIMSIITTKDDTISPALKYVCKYIMLSFNLQAFQSESSQTKIDNIEDSKKLSCLNPINETLQFFLEYPETAPMHSVEQSSECAWLGTELMVDKGERLMIRDQSRLFGLQKNWKQNLKYDLLQLSNYFNSCIVFGVKSKPCNAIQGVQLDQTKIKEIEMRINSIVKKDIYPLDDTIHLSFIKVRSDKDQKINSFQKKVVCLIKIQRVRERPFYFDNEFNNSQKGNYFDVSQQKQKKWKQMDQVEQKIYSRMLLNFSKYKQNRPRIAPKLKKFYGFRQAQIDLYSKESKIDKNKYGKTPSFEYTNSAIIVAKDRKIKDKLLDIFRKKGKAEQDTKQFKVFQKFTQYNKRQVFYLTTRGQLNNLIKVAEKIDQQKKDLIVLKIRKQISLCRQDFKNKAEHILIKRYEEYYNQKIDILWKRNPNNMKEKIYYYRFRTQEQSVFAFTLLECNDIRSIFISDEVIKGAQLLLESGQPIQKS